MDPDRLRPSEVGLSRRAYTDVKFDGEFESGVGIAQKVACGAFRLEKMTLAHVLGQLGGFGANPNGQPCPSPLGLGPQGGYFMRGIRIRC